MKHLWAMIVLLFLLSPLGAVSMKANSIGQVLGTFEEGDRYRLDVTAHSRTLYDEGRQVWVEIDQEQGPSLKTTTRTYRDGSIVRRSYDGGSLVEEQIGKERIAYTFDEDGRLITSSTTIGEGEPNLAYYSYAKTKPTLISVARLGDDGLNLARFVNESNRFTVTVVDEGGGQRYTTIGSLRLSDSWTVGDELMPVTIEETDEGFLQVREGGKTRTYLRSGLLHTEITEEYEKTFSYNEEGEVTSTRTQYPDQRVLIEYFSDQQRVQSKEFLGERSVKDTVYHDDDTYTETLYDREGVPYVDVTWAKDGMRATAIRYH